MMSIVEPRMADVWQRSQFGGFGQGVFWVFAVSLALLFAAVPKAGAQETIGAAPAQKAEASEGKSKSKRSRAERRKTKDVEKEAVKESPVSEAVAADNPTPEVLPLGQRRVSMTLKQMGAWSSFKVRGVDASRILGFTLRPTEYVVSARLNMVYDYSPSLLPDLSHLKVLINERMIGVDPLPSGGRTVGIKRSWSIPAQFFDERNELRFNLIGHYTRQCENPNHSSLWLMISDLTRLELVIGTKLVAPDLKSLPDPFLDRTAIDVANLNFVLPKSPKPQVVQAAGIVASWFGIQAGARGIKFTTTFDELPPGNSVVFLLGNQPTAGYTGVPASSVSIQQHPTQPSSRVLLVNGGTEAELIRAARSIALVQPTMIGASVNLVKDAPGDLRKPYDAPTWVRLDRAMKVGELARMNDLRVQAYYPDPIRVNYRVPPDVFTWRSNGVPLDLKFRATRLPLHQNSNLEIGVNGRFVDSIALNSGPGATPTLSMLSQVNRSLTNAALMLPPYATGGRDQLQLGFTFDVLQQGDCQGLPPNNMTAAIDPESTIDFSSFPRYAALPNLSYFAQIGYPYTVQADLARTAVVMPDSPGPGEVALYLGVMARLAESTGFPATQHVVTNSKDMSYSSHDLLIFGSGQNQKLFTDWAQHLPMVIENGTRRVREPYVSWRPQYRWEQADTDPALSKQAEITLAALNGLTAIMAFESPLKDARSVVFFYADQEQDHLRTADLISDPTRVDSINGDFVVVGEKTTNIAKVSKTYYVGGIPWLKKVRWFLADNPLIVAFLAVILSLLAAVVLYRPMRYLVELRRTGINWKFWKRKPEAAA
jgi:cellulose synthase operon protein B